MNHDLIERYIYAVTKRMNRRQRDDVAQELRTLVDDMLTERCGERIPTEKDVRVVLTELGTPQELYSQYAQDADACLIGQPYYSTYIFVMKLVLLSVLGGMTIAHGLLALLEPKDFVVAVLGWLNGIWNGSFSAFGCVTLLFALMQRKGIRIGDSCNLDDLPPVPKATDLIPRWEPISSIVCDIVFLILFLFAPQVFCAFFDGKMIPLFDTDVVRSTWLLILTFSLCGIVREVFQLLEGRYNRKVMVTALVADGISAVLCTWWLKGFAIMNPEFYANLDRFIPGESEIVRNMFSNFDSFFLGCMLLALALDAVDVTVRTLRNKE